MTPEFERLLDEAEVRERAWKEAHKNDPCARCGSSVDVEIQAYGSLAKLTPHCATCWRVLGEITSAYYKGYADGEKAAELQRPWWQRLCAGG